jgi:hypothetical protein
VTEPLPRTSAEQEACTIAAHVAGLARTVEALDQRVAELARLDRRVDTLAETLARVVMNLPAHKGTDSALPTAVSWLSRPVEPGRDPAESRAVHDAEQLLDKLADWVTRVYLCYSDARLPDCWLWHADVVEELLWLHAAWHAAYDPDAPTHAVGDWHDRQRPGVVRRIKQYAGMCSLEAHLPNGERHRPSPAAPTPDATPVIARWWATARDNPGPVPTEEQLAAANERMRRARR